MQHTKATPDLIGPTGSRAHPPGHVTGAVRAANEPLRMWTASTSADIRTRLIYDSVAAVY